MPSAGQGAAPRGDARRDAGTCRAGRDPGGGRARRRRAGGRPPGDQRPHRRGRRASRAADLRPRVAAPAGGAAGTRRGGGAAGARHPSRTPLRWPLATGRIVVGSPFGTREGRPHEGIDLPAPVGTPVFAAADGRVVYAGNGIRGYGNLVVVQARRRSADRLRAQLGAAGGAGPAGARRRSHRAGGPERPRDRSPLAFRGAGRADSQEPDGIPPRADATSKGPSRDAGADRDARRALLRARVRDVPDFPKPGILFRDLTPLMGDGAALREAVDLLAEVAVRHRPELIVAIESRGFIFGAPVAASLGVGFVPVRKPGKLPHKTRRRSYDLEYGTDALEMHADAVVAGRARGHRRRSAGDRRHRGRHRRAGARDRRRGRRRGVRRRADPAARARPPRRRPGRRCF